MKQLQLKDIAGYLPYKLKVQSDYMMCIEKIITQVDFGLPNYWRLCINDTQYIDYDKLKPILRPMSDLDKPMTHPDINNGEKFIPKNYMSDNLITDAGIGDTVSFYDTYMKGLQSEQYYSDWNIVLSFLNKLHFDYNDLISKGLAIDINTLHK